jgi:hypothetical protein
VQYVNLTEASEQLPSLIDAALSGEEVVIQKDERLSSYARSLIENGKNLATFTMKKAPASCRSFLFQPN